MLFFYKLFSFIEKQDFPKYAHSHFQFIFFWFKGHIKKDSIATSESEQKFSEFDSDLYTTTDIEVGETTTIKSKQQCQQNILPILPIKSVENFTPSSESNSDSEDSKHTLTDNGDAELKKNIMKNEQVPFFIVN